MTTNARTGHGGRRAILFTLDALLASLLLFAALVVALHFRAEAPPFTQTSHYAQDALLALSTIRAGDLNSTLAQQLVSNGTIPDPSVSVLQAIGDLWATNQTGLAVNLSRDALQGLLPGDVGVTLSMGGDALFQQNRSGAIGERAAAQRMITGIQQGEALSGSTSTAYLKRIRDKKSFVIAYFGGFTGQGNITVQLGPVPSDVNATAITDITAQLDTVADFDLLVNGAACTTLTSDATLMTVQAWNLTGCKGDIVPGMNNITLVERGALADSYVAGGYLKLSYLTDAFQDSTTPTGWGQYAFPQIDGIINLYDSFYAPGIITDWYLNLSYDSNYTVFLRIGNQTVFSSPGSNATQNIILEAHNLSWAPATIPLRLGTTNFTNVTFVQAGQPADTTLVTDVSGSMGDCGENYTGLLCKYKCSWWFFSYYLQCAYPGSCSNQECGACNPGWTAGSYSTPTATICNRTKLQIAQSADKLAASIILNVSGDRVGLDSFNDQVTNAMDLTTDQAALGTQIDGYTANGGTCICCGINRAKNMLNGSVNKRFMIVMTDGQPNYRCDNFDDYAGTADTAGAPQSTIDAGQNACDNYNITVFTIGFGADANKTLLQQVACNSSLYYDATNVSQLEQIYQNISDQILLIANFSAQTLVINGSYAPSHLLAGSTLSFNYTPIVTPPSPNEIQVKFETPQFANCTTTLAIPPGLRITDAAVTSYSGPYWTTFLSVNGQPVYNLSDYNADFVTLGDPFLVAIPAALLNGTNNTIRMMIADNSGNATNCSGNNSIIYTGMINSTIPRSAVLSTTEGCNWEVEFEDGHFLNFSIPSTYTGAKNCTYTNASHGTGSYDPNDAYDYGVYHILQQLDLNGDGRVFVNLDQQDLEIIVTLVQQVPYLWGPTEAALEVDR